MVTFLIVGTEFISERKINTAARRIAPVTAKRKSIAKKVSKTLFGIVAKRNE